MAAASALFDFEVELAIANPMAESVLAAERKVVEQGVAESSIEGYVLAERLPFGSAVAS